MRELEFLSIIKNQLDDISLLGDDCAYLEDLGVFITQDTLVEDVHFSMYTIDAYTLATKALKVNLSDLAANLAKPLYVSISLSLPYYVKDDFIREFYKGVNDICKEYNIKVSGGDITGSPDKIMISVCAVGKKISKYFASRGYAKKGDLIYVTGNFGSSGAAFYALKNYLFINDKLKKSHLNPSIKVNEALYLAENITENITMIDASDGLADALFRISQESLHSLEIDINKVPVDNELISFCKYNNLDYKNFVKWGAEDYELVMCISENNIQNLDLTGFTCIGKVLNKDNNPSVIIKDSDKTEIITKHIFEENSFDHFKESK